MAEPAGVNAKAGAPPHDAQRAVPPAEYVFERHAVQVASLVVVQAVDTDMVTAVVMVWLMLTV